MRLSSLVPLLALAIVTPSVCGSNARSREAHVGSRRRPLLRRLELINS